jgi:hypothetical protein
MSLGQENRTVIATEFFEDPKELRSILESFKEISKASELLTSVSNVTFEVISGRYQKSKAQLIEVSLTDNSIVHDVEITSHRPQLGG